jgi:hypothetical protein
METLEVGAAQRGGVELRAPDRSGEKEPKSGAAALLGGALRLASRGSRSAPRGSRSSGGVRADPAASARMGKSGGKSLARDAWKQAVVAVRRWELAGSEMGSPWASALF